MSLSISVGQKKSKSDKPFAANGRHNIGANPAPSEPEFIGKYQANFGFGADCSPAFLKAFYRCLIQLEVDELNARGIRHKAKSDPVAKWMSSIRNAISHVPSSIMSAEDMRLRYVLEATDALGPGLGSVIEIHHVHTDPEQWSVGDGPEPWQYDNFARIIWGGLAMNLRTREMLQPQNVWRRLNQLFDDFQTQRGHWSAMSDKNRRLEKARYVLALYEQTCHLLQERALQSARYRKLISERQPRGWLIEDVVLVIPEWRRSSQRLAEAQACRVEAFHQLLDHFFSYCHAAVKLHIV